MSFSFPLNLHSEWQVSFILAVCILLLAYGIYLFFDTIRFLKKAVKAKGKVVAESTDADDRDIQDPVIRFIARDGKSYTFVSDFGANIGMPKPGTKVNVLYDPLKPHRARWDDFFALWLMPLFCVLFSLAGIVFTVWHMSV